MDKVVKFSASLCISSPVTQSVTEVSGLMLIAKHRAQYRSHFCFLFSFRRSEHSRGTHMGQSFLI